MTPFRARSSILGSAVLVAAVASSTLIPAAGAQEPTTTTTEPTTTTTTTTVAPTTVPPTTTPPPAPPEPTALPITGPELAERARGRDVALMQIRLLERGYWLSEGFGTFGASTRHALTAFQKYHRLPRTGRLDAATRFVLAGTKDRPVMRTPRPGRAVEVDIARQVLMVAENGNVLVVLDVSTGKASTPTPRGNFRFGRQINGLRISRLGKLWRPKYFTGGYAIHGSPSVPTSPASHGCVRLTDQEINFLWDANLVPLGTPISLY